MKAALISLIFAAGFSFSPSSYAQSFDSLAQSFAQGVMSLCQKDFPVLEEFEIIGERDLTVSYRFTFESGVVEVSIIYDKEHLSPESFIPRLDKAECFR